MGSALESLQLNSHSERAQRGDTGAGGAGLAAGQSRRGGKGRRDCKDKEPVLVEAGQGAGRAAGAQGFWAVFFARHLQRGSEFSLCSSHTVPSFPNASGFLPLKYVLPSEILIKL